MNPIFNMQTSMGQMADQLRLHTKLQQFFAVGGVAGEPMAGITNRVLQILFQRRMPWKFNVEEFAPFPYGSGNFMVTQQGFQQVKFAGASVFVLLPISYNGILPQTPTGGCGIDLASYTSNNFTYPPLNGGTNSVTINPANGVITVQTLDPHPYQAANVISGAPVAYLSGLTNPAFNSVYTYNNLLSTAAWTQGYAFTAIIDQYHFSVQGILGQQYATITNITASAGNTTVLCTNQMSTGDVMTFTGITTNSALNGQTVTLTGATATSVTFATPTGITITNGSDTGTIYAAPSGAPGIRNWGWMQSANIYDLNSYSFPMPNDDVEAVHRTSKEYSTTGDNLSVSMIQNLNNGVLVFRLSEPVSTYPWGIGMTYQKRAPILRQPGDIIPWPDDMSYVIFEMCLWQGMRFAYGISAEESQAQQQNAMAAVMSALESEDRESNTESLSPNWSLFR